jgi:glycosyltransferase involved in cell wall biosynthesis
MPDSTALIDAVQSRYVASAIVSTYNADEFIRGRIDDLLAQTLGDRLEIIVVNSGSNQSEDTIIQKEYLGRYPNIRYVRTTERETIYAAWNRGIRMSTAPYITNANTDDRLHPDAIRRLVAALEAAPSCAIAYADQYRVNVKNIIFAAAPRNDRIIWPVFSPLRLFLHYICGPQALWRSSVHSIDNIWFDESFEVAGDYDFACRIGMRYGMVKVNEVLGLYYLSAEKGNKEHQEPGRTDAETYAVKEKYANDYLRSLSHDDFMALYRRLRLKAMIPRIGYAGVHRIIDTVAPQWQILPKIFHYWLLSLMEEQKGDMDAAIRFAENYRDVPSGGMMRMRYDLLRTKLSSVA